MSKTLTEQWREGTLPDDTYYWKVCKENWIADKYEMYDYTKVCDVDKIECLAPVPDYMDCKRLRYDSIELDKAKIKIYELVSKTDELMQKIHILNEQSTKQYNELCDEIKKNNILEKRLEIATKALKKYMTFCRHPAEEALKEMEGVK